MSPGKSWWVHGGVRGGRVGGLAGGGGGRDGEGEVKKALIAATVAVGGNGRKTLK